MTHYVTQRYTAQYTRHLLEFLFRLVWLLKDKRFKEKCKSTPQLGMYVFIISILLLTLHRETVDKLGNWYAQNMYHVHQLGKKGTIKRSSLENKQFWSEFDQYQKIRMEAYNAISGLFQQDNLNTNERKMLSSATLFLLITCAVPGILLFLDFLRSMIQGRKQNYQLAWLNQPETSREHELESLVKELNKTDQRIKGGLYQVLSLLPLLQLLTSFRLPLVTR